MTWSERYPAAEAPDMQAISAFIANPLWDALCAHLQTSYGTAPSIAYSTCPMAPGWNVKYRKSGRALCTLYPDDGFFTCLTTIGSKEAPEAELLMPMLSEYITEMYNSTKPLNGARWLMIRVTTPEILEDVKRLIALRVSAPRRAVRA